ncbi:MAG: twitching motility protein PilT [Enterovirga sp.]|nr:twitching motility protein PilT [Enterovirga sp.]
MIAVDTSALVAIAREEPDAYAFNEAIASGPVVIGTPALVEASMVLPSVVTQDAADRFLAQMLGYSWIEPVAFSFEMYEAAKMAFGRFGRGRGHPAQLNFGDCMSYAVAKVLDVPLLYKGNDFALTDIRSALA